MISFIFKISFDAEESYTTFNPMLAEVVGASVFPEHVVAPIRPMLCSCRFVIARVTDVNLASAGRAAVNAH